MSSAPGVGDAGPASRDRPDADLAEKIDGMRNELDDLTARVAALSDQPRAGATSARPTAERVP